MTHTIAILMVLCQLVIAVCLAGVLVVLATFAKDIRDTVASLERLTNHLDQKLDPMERQLSETLVDTQRTLAEVRTTTARLGDTTQFVGDRVKEVGALVKFVTDRLNSPVVRTVSAATGIKVGLAHLVEGLRKRKDDGHGR